MTDGEPDDGSSFPPAAEGETSMHDYDRRTAAATYGKEGLRLRALAEEMNAMEARLRDIADEIAFRPEYLKRLPREFRSTYDIKRALREIETAAVKVGTVVSLVRSGADVIESYDDPP
jgi:lipopolysaccharide biosynthesis protein